MLELLWSPGYTTSFLPACADSNFKDLKKSTCSRDPKADEARGESKELSTNISVLYPLKFLERLIYARVEPIIDPLLPKQQDGFRRRKSTVD